MKCEILPLTDEEAEYVGGRLAEYVRSVAPPRPGAEEDEVVLKIEPRHSARRSARRRRPAADRPGRACAVHSLR